MPAAFSLRDKTPCPVWRCPTQDTVIGVYSSTLGIDFVTLTCVFCTGRHINVAVALYRVFTTREVCDAAAPTCLLHGGAQPLRSTNRVLLH